MPYIYVPSKMALGRACGVSRAVISASITYVFTLILRDAGVELLTIPLLAQDERGQRAHEPDSEFEGQGRALDDLESRGIPLGFAFGRGMDGGCFVPPVDAENRAMGGFSKAYKS